MNNYQEENTKYYTPSIEDLRVGYKCEIKMPDSEDKWIPYVLGIQYNALTQIVKKEPVILPEPEIIRTPYLTKEQIEAEGWKDVGGERINNFFAKGKYMLNVANNRMVITNGEKLDFSRTGPYNGTIFVGSCPSINEFRTICKLLNI